MMATSPGGDEGMASAYGRLLLSTLGVPPLLGSLPREHPAVTWAESGLMALTGHADGAPLMCPAPLAACADGALAALASIAPPRSLEGLRGSQLLAERAAIFGYQRRGLLSPGGSCRLMEAADGWIALNLARDDDWELVPAWLESGERLDWQGIAAQVRERKALPLVERGREFGLAIGDEPITGGSPAPLSALMRSPRPQAETKARAPSPSARRAPIVLDLSALWAGPLCGHLLHKVGAVVVKVESTSRPDGARTGPAAFFDLLNAGKSSVALDLARPQGRVRLRRLLERADIVIEGSRPRALRQLGLRAEEFVAANPRLTWISITGHGRGEPQENWIAYGDDAGVAGGLSRVMRKSGSERVIVGDAVADPLTGIHAALAAWAGWSVGGGGLVSLPLAEVVRQCIAFESPLPLALRERQRNWTEIAQRHGVKPPAARKPAASARELGADTATVFAELGIPG